MWLEAVRLPDALHRAQADAGGFGHRSPGPMRDVSGRLGARQRQHFRHRLRRQRRLTRLAGLVAKKAIHPLFSKALLPAPYGRAADPTQARDIENAAALRGMENNLCPLHMLLQAIAISDDGGQARAVFGRENGADGLSHVHTIAYFADLVNPKFASVH